MRRKRYYILPQYYPDHRGVKSLSFAIYVGRTFLAYSWSLAGAWIALQIIKGKAQWQKTTRS